MESKIPRCNDVIWLLTTSDLHYTLHETRRRLSSRISRGQELSANQVRKLFLFFFSLFTRANSKLLKGYFESGSKSQLKCKYAFGTEPPGNPSFRTRESQDASSKKIVEETRGRFGINDRERSLRLINHPSWPICIFPCQHAMETINGHRSLIFLNTRRKLSHSPDYSTPEILSKTVRKIFSHFRWKLCKCKIYDLSLNLHLTITFTFKWFSRKMYEQKLVFLTLMPLWWKFYTLIINLILCNR